MKKLIFYYGRECPHCHAMMPFVDRLSKEEKIKIEKIEVWHDEKNAEKMRRFEGIIREACGGEFGVPVFVDETNNKAFCGERPYSELLKWIKEK